MISIIVATDAMGGVGKDNDIPWMGQFPEDMKFFKKTTNNGIVVMGNNTWNSLPQAHRPLPNRYNIVVTSMYKDSQSKSQSVMIPSDDFSVVHQIQSLHEESDIFIIGGPTLWNSTLSIVDRIYITKIPGDYNCDVFFQPNLDDFTLAKTIPLKKDNMLDVYVYERIQL